MPLVLLSCIKRNNFPTPHGKLHQQYPSLSKQLNRQQVAECDRIACFSPRFLIILHIAILPCKNYYYKSSLRKAKIPSVIFMSVFLVRRHTNGLIFFYILEKYEEQANNL